jgi:hypothetical protein
MIATKGKIADLTVSNKYLSNEYLLVGERGDEIFRAGTKAMTL